MVAFTIYDAEGLSSVILGGVRAPPPPRACGKAPASPSVVAIRPTGNHPCAHMIGSGSADETLVAREAELSHLLSAHRAVAAGIGRLVLLTGEPGIGNTRPRQCESRTIPQ